MNRVQDTVHYNTMESITAQKEYCESKSLPHFAPSDGYCPNCHNPIYITGGYPVEYAKMHLITGCPFCKRSFCD